MQKLISVFILTFSSYVHFLTSFKFMLFNYVLLCSLSLFDFFVFHLLCLLPLISVSSFSSSFRHSTSHSVILVLLLPPSFSFSLRHSPSPPFLYLGLQLFLGGIKMPRVTIIHLKASRGGWGWVRKEGAELISGRGLGARR